jgi:arylformamidase
MPMSEPIDISVDLRRDMPVWPGSVAFKDGQTQTFANGDDVFVSRIEMDVHVGTHVESPLHFIPDGATLDSVPLSTFVGPAFVADLLAAEPAVGAEELEAAAIPEGTSSLLLRTENSALWASGDQFRNDYVALTADGARWVVERGIRLVGIDYLSIAPYGESVPTHRTLLEAGIVILEGTDLRGVDPGEYELVCAPLRIVDADGAPARAFLVRR